MTASFAPTRRRCLGLAAAALLRPDLALAHADHHAGHPVDPGVQRREVDYRVPGVDLVRDDGRRVAFASELAADRLVMLNFVFTTCTAICPVTSQIFAETQGRLAPLANRLQMLSVSIDPEQDTPAKLREYARRFGAGPQWRHYTGSPDASIVVQKAFDAWRGDKMNHQPLTLLRAPGTTHWVRLEGFVSPTQLAAEARTLLGA
jgi:protein SCO1/2